LYSIYFVFDVHITIDDGVKTFNIAYFGNINVIMCGFDGY